MKGCEHLCVCWLGSGCALSSETQSATCYTTFRIRQISKWEWCIHSFESIRLNFGIVTLQGDVHCLHFPSFFRLPYRLANLPRSASIFEIREFGFLFRSSILYYECSKVHLVRSTAAYAVFELLFFLRGFRIRACFRSFSKFRCLRNFLFQISISKFLLFHCIFEISWFSLYFRNFMFLG